MSLRYVAYGHVLESPAAIPELPPAAAATAVDFVISFAPLAPPPSDLRWSIVWPASQGSDEAAFSRAGRTRYIRVGKTITATVSDEDLQIGAAEGVDAATLRHVLLDQILPLTLASAGLTVLHASAVDIDGGAVLFIGDAGAGKSTLAAALSLRGFALLADDGVLLDERSDGVHAVPSYPGVRLWPDAAGASGLRGFGQSTMTASSPKRRLIPRQPVTAAARPIAAIYSLSVATDGRTRLARMSRRDATLALLRNAFTPEPDVPHRLAAQFDRACRFSRTLPVWSLACARDLTALAELADAVVRHGRAAASDRLLAR